VYSECPSYDDIIPAMLARPLAALPDAVHFKPGIPVKPMLAKPTTGVGEVLDKFTDAEFTVEYKYDGERAQVHVDETGRVWVRPPAHRQPRRCWPAAGAGTALALLEL
jgi:DNA ligase-1